MLSTNNETWELTFVIDNTCFVSQSDPWNRIGRPNTFRYPHFDGTLGRLSRALAPIMIFNGVVARSEAFRGRS